MRSQLIKLNLYNSKFKKKPKHIHEELNIFAIIISISIPFDALTISTRMKRKRRQQTATIQKLKLRPETMHIHTKSTQISIYSKKSLNRFPSQLRATASRHSPSSPLLPLPFYTEIILNERNKMKRTYLCNSKQVEANSV